MHRRRTRSRRQSRPRRRWGTSKRRPTRPAPPSPHLRHPTSSRRTPPRPSRSRARASSALAARAPSHGRQQRRRLPRRILRVDRLLDLPVGPDHVREALRVLVLRTLARLVREPDLALRVAQEREPVPELLGERLVLLRRVERDAEHGDALRLVVADSITEPAALLRSPRRVGLGEEPEHDALAAQIRELHLPTEVILHL